MLRLLGPLLRTLRLLTHHAHCCCWLIKVITKLPLQMVACLFSSCRSTRSIIPLLCPKFNNNLKTNLPHRSRTRPRQATPS